MCSSPFSRRPHLDTFSRKSSIIRATREHNLDSQIYPEKGLSILSQKAQLPSPCYRLRHSGLLRGWRRDLWLVREHGDVQKGRPGTCCACPGVRLGRKHLCVYLDPRCHMQYLQSPYPRTSFSASIWFCHTVCGTVGQPLFLHLLNAAITTSCVGLKNR